MLKRWLDITIALVLALPALCIVGLAALVVRLDSPGPALFKQIRVGRHRRPFMLVKLRTMRVETANRASHEVSVSQITRIGSFLRRTKLDELPQLWCVLNGDMSFVGPRPCLPSQTELIHERDIRGVYALRPGITGPAQLAGIDMSTPRELAIADAAYIGRDTIAADLKLMVATAVGRGSGDAVR